MRIKRHFYISCSKRLKRQLFHWFRKFKTVVWLDTNNYPDKYTCFESCLAIDEFTSIKTDYKNAFKKLSEYQLATRDYIFGYMGYDLKNDIENLSSNNFDELKFDDLYFFQPKKLIFISENTIEFQYLPEFEKDIETDFNSIVNISFSSENECINNKKSGQINIKPRISKQNYHHKIIEILKHIAKGDVYEVNFCQEFYADNTVINPYQVYVHLNEISKSPFATFLKIENRYLLSSSPERYLSKRDEKVISQPIKGTAKHLSDKDADQKTVANLLNDQKERSENVMIVDLVRNDLSKIAKRASVKVEELCKIYTFKQVHHLISTVTAEVSDRISPVEIIKNTFPMGSMTGAPKISAMEIIEQLEQTKRGIYSGAVGYFSPNGDFDFNVVIRTILYNQLRKYLSFSVGSAITAKSTPEKEYRECLIKAEAMKLVLSYTQN